MKLLLGLFPLIIGIFYTQSELLMLITFFYTNVTLITKNVINNTKNITFFNLEIQIMLLIKNCYIQITVCFLNALYIGNAHHNFIYSERAILKSYFCFLIILRSFAVSWETTQHTLLLSTRPVVIIAFREYQYQVPLPGDWRVKWF